MEYLIWYFNGSSPFTNSQNHHNKFQEPELKKNEWTTDSEHKLIVASEKKGGI